MSKQISREYIERIGKKKSYVNNTKGRTSKAVHADEADEVPWTGVQDVITWLGKREKSKTKG